MRYYGWFHQPLAGETVESDKFPGFTVYQMSIFFTTYIFFQVWNEVNCRSLVPNVSGLAGLHRNPTFLMVVGVIVLFQVLIVTFLGPIFDVQRLGWQEWLIIAAATASVLVFSEVVRRVRVLMGWN
jgi:Ca2+-transporting ATPase